jgi:hypothetical protein
VGPGKARATSAFAVSLDPQLITSVRITAVELNRKPYRGGADLTATRRTDSLYQTRWRVPVRLAPGDVLDVTLTATRIALPGALPTRASSPGPIRSGSDLRAGDDRHRISVRGPGRG